MSDLVLSVDRLAIIAPGRPPILDEVSLSVARGEVVALIGESGSGKTTLALSALGYVRAGMEVTGGSIRLGSYSLFEASRQQLEQIRGRKVSYIAQSAAASFNPRIRLTRQIVEASQVHRTAVYAAAVARAHAIYQRLELPNSQSIGDRFPYQVSGGQLQRFMIAMGIIEGPDLLVCDEPTSALDVTTQVEVLKALKKVIVDGGLAALFVSHDLAVVAQIADRVVVMRSGRIVEAGTVARILTAAQAPYTQQLIDACNRRMGSVRQSATTSPSASIVEVRQLRASFNKETLPVVTDVSFSLRSGNVLGIVGESGSGKSTLARCIAGLHVADSGSIKFRGREMVYGATARSLDERRGIQFVPQIADTALNPRHSIAKILGRVLTFFNRSSRGQHTERRVAELLSLVHLPAHYASLFPSQLSGGEKQRVNIARALAADPAVLICDEITSSLDTILAASIIRLLEDLRDRLGFAIIFISHDLFVVSSLANELIVLKNGKVVEQGNAQAILSKPKHPYTQLLVRSVPELRPGWLEEFRVPNCVGQKSDLLPEQAEENR